MLAFHKFPPFELERPHLCSVVGGHRCIFYSLDWLKKAMESDCGTRAPKSNTLEHFVLQTASVSMAMAVCPVAMAVTRFCTWTGASTWKGTALAIPLHSDHGHVWPWFSCGFCTRSFGCCHQPSCAAPRLMELLPCRHQDTNRGAALPRSAVCTSGWVPRGSLGQQSTSQLRVTKVVLKRPNLVNESS